MLTEAVSSDFKQKYVSLPGGLGWLLENGILITKEIRGLTPAETRKQYTELLQSNIRYDYTEARMKGILKRLPAAVSDTGTVSVPEKTGEVSPAVQDTGISDVPPAPADTGKRELPKSAQDTELQEKALPVIIVILFVIGTLAMILSIYYSATALRAYLSGVLAFCLAFMMVVFNSTAFNLVAVFRNRRQWLNSIVFALLFVTTTAYSMSNTMQVNYNRYTAAETKSLAEHKDTNTARIQIESYTSRITAKEDEITAKDAEIKAKDEQIAYAQSKGYGFERFLKEKTRMQSDKTGLLNDKSALIEAKSKISESTPDAVLTQETRDTTFYDAVSAVMKGKISASDIQFWLSVLPSLFIDIIAPFALTTGIQLMGKKRRNTEQ